MFGGDCTLLGEFGEVLHVELAMDRTVSLYHRVYYVDVELLFPGPIAWNFFLLCRLIFQKDMPMLNSRQDLMLKKLYCTWMVYDFSTLLKKNHFMCWFFSQLISLPAFMQGQIDGNVVRAKFTLPQRQKVSSPPKAAGTAVKRDGPKTDNVGTDVGKDGPKRQREGII